MSGTVEKKSRSRRPRWLTLPIVMLVLSLLYVGSALRPDRDDSYQVSGFSRIPVVDQGRIKPIDSLARISLMIISNKQGMYLKGDSGTSDRFDTDGHEKVTATRWLLDVLARPDRARNYQVIRIDHPDVLGLIGADPDRKYFSLNEVMEHQPAISGQIDRAQRVSSKAQTPYQRAIMRLSRQLGLYLNLEETVNLHVLPPLHEDEEWETLASALHTHEGETASPHPASETFISALRGWHNESPGDFNAAVAAHLALVEAQARGVAQRVNYEILFNRFAPFIRAMGLYVLVFLLAILSWLRMSRPLVKAALWVLIVALIVHTIGLFGRIYIQGRPPVTNLYSSAIFVGWGACLLAWFLERLFRNGIGAVAAAVCGFVTLLVAHHLSLDGDTMTMMQAVLDTNFWLATHVVVITLGYSATFLAGFLGTLYILRGVFTRSLSRQDARSLGRMIYGIICFAALFSFVGTILGGIWADQSWGRFWGWDPKENGALLIVIWNALILHARWGGMARQRGLAVLAVGGNIVTAWSWFGTNMLGVGLHSYGFIDSAVFWMLMFVLSQLILMGIGMIPLDRWRSRRVEETPSGDGPPTIQATTG